MTSGGEGAAATTFYPGGHPRHLAVACRWAAAAAPCAQAARGRREMSALAIELCWQNLGPARAHVEYLYIAGGSRMAACA